MLTPPSARSLNVESTADGSASVSWNLEPGFEGETWLVWGLEPGLLVFSTAHQRGPGPHAMDFAGIPSTAYFQVMVDDGSGPRPDSQVTSADGPVGGGARGNSTGSSGGGSGGSGGNGSGGNGTGGSGGSSGGSGAAGSGGSGGSGGGSGSAPGGSGGSGGGSGGAPACVVAGTLSPPIAPRATGPPTIHNPYIGPNGTLAPTPAGIVYDLDGDPSGLTSYLEFGETATFGWNATPQPRSPGRVETRPGLAPDTQYFFRIHATNNFGSAVSDCFKGRTAQQLVVTIQGVQGNSSFWHSGRPLAPRPVSFFVVNSDSQRHSLEVVGTSTSFSVGDFNPATPGNHSRLYTLPSGSYSLACRFHASMTGTLTVV